MANFSLKRTAIALALVLGLAGAVLLLVIWPRYRQAAARTPESDSFVLRTAIEQWEVRMHRCPTAREMVDEKSLDPPFANDPWGSPYLIECLDERIKIRSLGPDHRLGTQDDIVMSKRRRR